MIVFVDELENTTDISVYYENSSASPPRQPIQNAMIVIYMYNESGISDGLWRIFTDDEGTAQFDYTNWADGEFAMKILYCPFCCPLEEPNEWCGWNECLKMAEIQVGLGTEPEDVPVPSGHTVPSELNCNAYRPSMQLVIYNPPPKEPTAAVPLLCTIGLLIFALLGGALHLSGRNPFMGFNLGRPRVGRHIRYQARGRGWALNLGAAVSSIRSATREGRQATKDRRAGKSRSFKERFGYNSPLAAFRSVGRVLSGKYAQRRTVDDKGQISAVDEDKGERRVLDDSARLFRQGNAYLKGGKLKGGKIVSMTSSQRGQAYGRFVGKQIVALAAGLFDRSLLGRIVNFDRSMSERLQERLNQSEYETRANAIAAYEQEQQLRGNGERLEILVADSQQETVLGVGDDCSVIETELVIGGETTQVRIIVRTGDEARIREALAAGNMAGVSCVLEVAGESGQVTRYDIRDGTVHQVQQSYVHEGPDGSPQETILVYSVDAPSDSPATFWTRESQLTLVGAFVDGEEYRAVGTGEDRVGFFRVTRAASVAGPEELATTAAFSSLGEGAIVDLEGGAAEAIASGVALSGQTMEDAGMTAFSDTNRQLTAIGDRTVGALQLMDQIRNTLDSNVSIISEQYNDQLGQIEVERGSLFSQGPEGDDLTIRVVDSGAVIEGERRERALGDESVIHITDGRISSVTDAVGQAVDGVSVAGGSISISGDDGAQAIDVTGGELLDRDRQLMPAVQERVEAVGRYAQVWADQNADRLESQYGPDRREALDEYARIMSGAVAIVTPEPAGRTSPETRAVRDATIEVLEQTRTGSVVGASHTERAIGTALELRYPELATRARREAAVQVLAADLTRKGENPADVTPERAAEVLGISVDQLVEVAESRQLPPQIAEMMGIPTFDQAYHERTSEMISEIPASDRGVFLGAVRDSERLGAEPAYEQTATRLFRESAGDTPLARLGLSIADMTEAEARVGLQSLGLEPREVRRAMRGFSGLQESARTYRQASLDAATRAPSIGNQTAAAGDALLTFVPPEEELHQVIPREKDETDTDYSRRLQDFRRHTAGEMAVALSQDRRTDTAGELGTDAGRGAALDVCSRVLIGALDQAAEREGGRVVGYETSRYIASTGDLLDRLARSDRHLVDSRYQPPPDDAPEHTVVTDYTAFLASTMVDGASRRPQPTVRRGARMPADPDARGMPVSVYHTLEDAVSQYVRGNHTGIEEKKGDREPTHAEERGSMHLFEDAAAAAQRFVRQEERRESERRTSEIRATTDSFTGAPESRGRTRTPPPDEPPATSPPPGGHRSGRGRTAAAPSTPPSPPPSSSRRPGRRTPPATPPPSRPPPAPRVRPSPTTPRTPPPETPTPAQEKGRPRRRRRRDSDDEEEEE